MPYPQENLDAWRVGLNWMALSSHSAADLLFTTGSLAGCLSSAGRIKKGQKHAEALLSGSIGIFEYLGARRGVAEAENRTCVILLQARHVRTCSKNADKAYWGT